MSQHVGGHIKIDGSVEVQSAWATEVLVQARPARCVEHESLLAAHSFAFPAGSSEPRHAWSYRQPRAHREV